MSLDVDGFTNEVNGGEVVIKIDTSHRLLKLAQNLPWELMLEALLSDLQRTDKKHWWMGRPLRVRIHLGVYILQQMFNLTDRAAEQQVRDLDVDSTIQEANIAFPAIANLLVKVAILASRIGKGLNQLCYAGEKRFRVGLSHLKQIALYYFNLKRKGESEDLLKSILKRLWCETYEQALPILNSLSQLNNKVQTGKHWPIRRAMETLQWRGCDLLRQIHGYLFEGLTNTAINSLHAYQAACFNKGKLNKGLQFGRSFQLGRIGNNFLFVGECTSLHMRDAQSLPAMLRLHENLFGKGKIESIATDKGYYSLEDMAENGLEAKEIDPELLKIKMDRSDATLTHYAASIFPAKTFAALIAFAPEEIHTPDQLGQLTVHVAAQSGNTSVLEYLIAREPTQREAKTNTGATPIIHAIQHGQLQTVETLLRLGANANLRLPNGLFPLYLAIQGNYPAIALLLLNQVPGLQISEKLDNGMTALHLAIELNLEEVALLLIEKGALLDAKRKSDGFTPYHVTAKKGKIDLIKAMLAKGLTPTIALESQKTALHLAAENGQHELVQQLLKTVKLSPDEKTNEQEVPLTLAIRNGHREVAEELALVTKIDTVNHHQQTLSQIALLFQMPTVSDILLERGESPTLQDDQGHDYLYYLVSQGEYHRFRAVMNQLSILSKLSDLMLCYGEESLLAVAARNGHFLLVYELLERFARYKTDTGLSLIHYAILTDEVGYLKEWLAEHDLDEANISTGIHKNQSLAHLAAQQGSHQCLKHLLKKLSKQNIEKQNLLTASIESGDITTFTLVLDRYQDINQNFDSTQNTALHLAVAQGALDMLALLATRGCNFTKRNRNKETAYHIAVKQEDELMLKQLFELSSAAEWPRDLWQLPDITPDIDLVLQQFGTRTSSQGGPTNPVKSTSIHSPCATDPKLLEEITALICEQNFNEAAHLVKQLPKQERIALFKSVQGGALLQVIFATYMILMPFLLKKKAKFKKN